MRAACAVFCLLAVRVWGQEAASGFELRTTITAAAFASDELSAPPRSGAGAAAGMRAMLYPTWKIGANWAVAGAVQVHTRPFFAEQFTTQGYGVRADLLQTHLTYSRYWKNSSLAVRAGQLSSAFGAFLLRYDDLDNPLVDMPPQYGYYYKGVTSYGLAGAQVDFTSGKLDARAQFVNSSPANRRSVFDSDQYGNWAAGAGYTIQQGLRIGVSAYRGPYLHREYRYYRPGEAKPRELPASAVGLDAQWARGHWSTWAEWQWFRREYRAMPTFSETVGYGEGRRVLHPRWYVAARVSYAASSAAGARHVYESALGFRPNRHQLIKAGYQITRRLGAADGGGAFAVQIVTGFRPLSIARD
jgi:hypothetical protein